MNSSQQELAAEDVLVADLVLDDRYQMRAELPAVDEFAEAAGSAVWPFPPIAVFRIRGKLYVVDGFTRVRAALSKGREAIPAVVHKGTKAEALKFSLSANSHHGYRRTNADKRKAVLIAKAEFSELSNGQLAKMCAVTKPFVGRVLKDAAGAEVEDQPEALGACPVCRTDAWMETDGGTYCAACRHPYGEPAGGSGADDDDAEVAAAIEGRVLKKPGPKKPEPKKPEPKKKGNSGTTAGQSAPGKLEQLSTDQGAKLNEAITQLGRFIRLAEDAGVYDQLAGLVQQIMDALHAAKKR